MEKSSAPDLSMSARDDGPALSRYLLTVFVIPPLAQLMTIDLPAREKRLKNGFRDFEIALDILKQ